MSAIFSLFKSKSPATPPPPKIPDSPFQARRGAGSAAAEIEKRRKALLSGGRRGSILGGGTQGDTVSKHLLGE